MLEHVRKRQEELRSGVAKSFMADGGAGAAGTGQNGFEESKTEDVEKSGMEKTMKEFKEGDLKSGSGAKVTDRDQAIAIGLSEEEKKKKEAEVNKGGVEPGTEAWDKKKDETSLKDIDLTKSVGNNSFDYLSSGMAMDVQRSRILGAYGLDIKKSKSGEGSKGGKVIGHTSSGKPIYENHDHPHHASFTAQDHKDAANTHAEASAKHSDKEDEHFEHAENMSGTPGGKAHATLAKEHQKAGQRHWAEKDKHVKSAEEAGKKESSKRDKMHANLDKKFKDDVTSWKDAPGEVHSMHAHLAETFNEESKAKASQRGESAWEEVGTGGHSRTPAEHNSHHKKGVKDLYDKVSDEGKKRFHEHYGHIVGE